MNLTSSAQPAWIRNKFLKCKKKKKNHLLSHPPPRRHPHDFLSSPACLGPWEFTISVQSRIFSVAHPSQRAHQASCKLLWWLQLTSSQETHIIIRFFLTLKPKFGTHFDVYYFCLLWSQGGRLFCPVQPSDTWRDCSVPLSLFIYFLFIIHNYILNIYYMSGLGATAESKQGWCLSSLAFSLSKKPTTKPSVMIKHAQGQ